MNVDDILKAAKKLSRDDKERLVFALTIEIPKADKIVHCQYCGCKLLMNIERKNKKCWDCHFEGKGNQ